MSFNIKEINRILNNIGDRTSSDYEIYGKTWTVWHTKMLAGNESYMQLHGSAIDSLLLFHDCGDYSEENFNKWFPTITYKKYVDPNTLFDYKRLSLRKIQAIAFELQEYIDLEFNLLVEALRDLYFFEPQFTFQSLTKCILRYDVDLHIKMLTCSITNDNNKNVA